MNYSDLAAALREIDEHDARRRRTPLTSALRWVTGHPAFSAVYKRVGPKIDPFLDRFFDGRLSDLIYGLPTCVLVTTGAKTGRRREFPLLYLRDDDDFCVLGTNFGQETHPSWTTNLLANPRAEFHVGSTRLWVRAELVEGEDWDRLFAGFVEMLPAYAQYLNHIDGARVPRLFRLSPQALAVA